MSDGYGEFTTAEIGRGVQEIKAALRELNHKVEEEVRGLRHRVVNAETAASLQAEINKRFEEHDAFLKDEARRHTEQITHLMQNAASQEAVDTAKRNSRNQMIAIVGLLGSLGITNLLINLGQNGGSP